MIEEMKQKSIILIIIDDVKADQFFTLIKNGHLPNIATLYQTSHYTNKCVTTFPSTTIPSHVSIFTGKYQDYYKIPCIKWFDKKNEKLHDYTAGLEGLTLINRDIETANAETIYEKIAGTSLVIFNGVTKGATHTKFNVIQNVSINFKRFLNTNSLPSLVTCWYFESDEKLHHFGSNSKHYIRQLKRIDRDIGKIISELKERQLFDRCLIIITSDHGNYSAERALNIEDYFKEQDMTFQQDYYVDFGGVGSFFFRGNDWNQSLTIENLKNYGKNNLNLVNFILNLPGVQYVAYKEKIESTEKGSIKIQGKHGVGMIEFNGELTKYEFEGDDPLKYELSLKASKLIDGKHHSIDEWLEHTIETDNIIVVDQLARILKIGNSADIIAVTDGKTVYHHLHSHDLPTPETMKVPFMMSNSKFKQKKLGLMKITEIYDIILNYLNP